MLHYLEGDLLESDCTVIMHQANCQKCMGGGIAKLIAEKYPLVEQADNECPYEPEYKYGKYSFAVLPNGVTVFNLYGQFNPGRAKRSEQNQRYRKLEEALHSALHLLNFNLGTNIDSTKVGVPYAMGCGLAGGDWTKVRKMLERLSEFHKIDIYIYKL